MCTRIGLILLEDEAISVGKLKSLVENNVVQYCLVFFKLNLFELFTKLSSLKDINYFKYASITRR